MRSAPVDSSNPAVGGAGTLGNGNNRCGFEITDLVGLASDLRLPAFHTRRVEPRKTHRTAHTSGIPWSCIPLCGI